MLNKTSKITIKANLLLCKLFLSPSTNSFLCVIFKSSVNVFYILAESDGFKWYYEVRNITARDIKHIAAAQRDFWFYVQLVHAHSFSEELKLNQFTDQ